MSRARAIYVFLLVSALVVLSANPRVASAQEYLPAPEARNGSKVGEVEVGWEAVPDAKFYRIGWLADQDLQAALAADREWLDAFVFVDVENLDQTSYTVLRLEPDAVHHFIMGAVDERFGEAQWSTWTTLTTRADQTACPIATVETNAATDRATLVELYHATGGPNWNNSNNWLSDRPLSEWHGVVTDSDRRVTRLDLRENGLTGNFPSELGNLSQMNSLHLGDNELSGSLPAQLQNLSNLESLYVWNNDLTGPVPDWLGNLANLKRLGLSKNGLTGTIPDSLGNLSNLNLINFGGNELSGPIPPQLQELSSLEELNLWENRLTGPIPAWLGDLTNLTRLDLHGNQLSGEIPDQLGNLTKLAVLRLAGNSLTGCVPNALRNVADNDLTDLGLLFCDSATPSFRLPDGPGVRMFDDPEVPYMKWEVGPEVSQAQFDLLRTGIVHMHRYASGLGLPDLPGDASFYLYQDLDMAAETLARLEHRSVSSVKEALEKSEWDAVAGLDDASSGYIFTNPVAIAKFEDNWRYVRIASHELSHIYQFTLGGGTGLGMSAASWMIEGFADFHGTVVPANAGLLDYESRRQHYVNQAERADVSLKATESDAGLYGGPGRYDMAVLAAEFLASETGEEPLITYWTLGPGITWQEAFNDAFGMTVDDFYTQFAEHRSSGFPAVDLH